MQVSRHDTEYSLRVNLCVTRLVHFLALFQRVRDHTELCYCSGWGWGGLLLEDLCIFVCSYLLFFFLLISTIPPCLAVPDA